MKKINGIAGALRDFTSADLTRVVSPGCSYLNPAVETRKVGIPGQLLPKRNNRRVTPAEHRVQGWETRGGGKEPLEIPNLAIMT